MTHTRAALAAAALVVALAPAAGFALDLETALREAAAESPTLLAHRAHADAARHRIGPAGAWTSPEVDVGLSREPMAGMFPVEMETMRMVGVSQRVPVFGWNRLARRAASDLAVATDEDVRAHWREVLAETWITYANAWHAGERAATARGHVAVMDRAVWAARSRYGSGRGRLDEVLRADADRARIAATVETYEAEAIAARARLDALRGRTYAGLLADTLVAPPQPELPIDPTPLRAAVAATHPRVREAEAKQSSYRASAASARRMVWPDLMLRASMAFPEAGEADGDREREWSASVGFMLPVFASSRELAEGREMDAMARGAAAEREETRLNLLARFDGALASAEAARRRLEALDDAVLPAARTALASAWTAYGAGTIDLAAVLNVSHALYDQELERTRAQEAYSVACARVFELTGRGDLLGIVTPEEEQR